MKEILGTKYYSMKESAELMSIGRTNLYKMMNSGQIGKPIVFGRRPFFSEDSIVAFLKAMTGKTDDNGESKVVFP